MKEEEQEEWVAFTKACAIIGEIVYCRYCNKCLIAEEVAPHLIENHEEEAKEAKKECRKRLDWEKKARVISDTTIEKLQ